MKSIWIIIINAVFIEYHYCHLLEFAYGYPLYYNKCVPTKTHITNDCSGWSSLNPDAGYWMFSRSLRKRRLCDRTEYNVPQDWKLTPMLTYKYSLAQTEWDELNIHICVIAVKQSLWECINKNSRCVPLIYGFMILNWVTVLFDKTHYDCWCWWYIFYVFFHYDQFAGVDDVSVMHVVDSNIVSGCTLTRVHTQSYWDTRLHANSSQSKVTTWLMVTNTLSAT